MEVEATQFALIVGVIMALIKVLEMIISKYFGLEKQVANHLAHRLEEMKECEAGNADRIIEAIHALHIDILKELKK